MKKIILVFVLIFGSIQAQEETPGILLPQPQREIGKPLMQALTMRRSAREFDARPLPLQELSNLLYAACGVNRPATGKRTVPSARNWQEIDVYVATQDGVYIYDAASNLLLPVVREDIRELFGVQDFVKSAPVNLLYVSDYAKIKSNDSEETKLIFTSAGAGFMAQNVYLYCASQDLAVVVRGLIPKEKLAKALNLRPEQKILLAQTVGYGK